LRDCFLIERADFSGVVLQPAHGRSNLAFEVGLAGDRHAAENLSAIRRVGLLTVEGENDDISGIGQTLAAQDLCQTLPHSMKANYLQEKVGHYGVFNGSRFRNEIVPRIREFHARISRPASALKLVANGGNKMRQG
jgi:poly-beta-hydroxyalkanoate depolymerase